MLKRISRHQSERRIGQADRNGGFAVDDTCLYFECIEASAPWAMRGDFVEVRPVFDGGVEDGELAVVRVGGRFQLEVRSAERTWRNGPRAVGRVMAIFRLPNSETSVSQRCAAELVAENAIRDVRLRSLDQ